MMKLKTLSALMLGMVTSVHAATDDNQTIAVQKVDTVVVTAKAQRSLSKASDGDLRDRVNLGLLGRQNAFNTPITVVNYDEKAFADKSPRQVVDVMAQTDASVMAFGGETNTLQGVYVRGLQLDARQFSVNGLAGLYSAYSSPNAAVGAAQLIKGASSATVGMDPEGAVGASVNIETKKATDKPIRQIGLAWYSDSRWQHSIDFGQRFGANKQFGARLNANLRKGDTPRDQYEEDSKEVALNLDYRGERLRAAIDGSYAKRATTGGRASVQDIQLFGFRLPEVPDGKINLSPAWQKQTTEDKSIQTTFEYDVLDNLTVSGGIGQMKSSYEGNFAQIQILNQAGDYQNAVPNNARTGFTTQGARPFDFQSKTTSANLKARGEFFTGNLSHNWNVAFDRVKRNRDHRQGDAINRNLMTGLNIYHPVFPAAPTFSEVKPNSNNTYTATSVALSDTLGMFQNKLRLTLGGRFQWMKQETTLASGVATNTQADAKRFSPMALVAYVPNNQLTVYGNYLEDLEPGAIDDDGNMSKPRVSRQAEMGVRKNWGNVVTTANVFQITRPTYWARSGKYNGIAHIAGETQGKERNRGIEFNTYANLRNQTLRPSFGVMYLKSDLIDAPSYTGVLLNGTQVSSPRVIAKAGIEWDTPFAQGLTLNAGVQHYGKSYQDSAKQYAFPSYTLVDVGAKYTMKLPQNQTLTLRGAVENVFNKNYWQVQRGQYDRSFAVVGMPRTFWMKADYAF